MRGICKTRGETCGRLVRCLVVMPRPYRVPCKSKKKRRKRMTALMLSRTDERRNMARFNKLDI